MALTKEQRERKKREQEKFIKDRTVRFDDNSDNTYICFLTKDNTLFFEEYHQIGGHFEGGVILSRNFNPQKQPYWKAVIELLNRYEKEQPDYHDKIACMLVKNQMLSNILALKITENTFGNVYDDIDLKILSKRINNKNLEIHNQILSEVNAILNDALLYMNCKILNKKTSKYENLSADERLKLVEKKFAQAKQVISKQFKDNKNEQANRDI